MNRKYVPLLCCVLFVVLVSAQDEIPDISCKPSKVVKLADVENGVTAVNPKAIDTANTQDAQYIVDPSTVSCVDVGRQIDATVTVINAANRFNSCQTKLKPVDKAPPNPKCVERLVVTLTDDSATVDLEAVEAGSTDNCAVASLELTNNVFGCKDFGWQEVVLTAIDTSGNRASCTTEVAVVAACRTGDLLEPSTLVHGTAEQAAFDNNFFTEWQGTDFIVQFAPVDVTFCGAVVHLGNSAANQEVTLTFSVLADGRDEFRPYTTTQLTVGTNPKIIIPPTWGRTLRIETTHPIKEITEMALGVFTRVQPTASCKTQQPLSLKVPFGGSLTIDPKQIDAGSAPSTCGTRVHLATTPTGFTCTDINTQQTVQLTVTDASLNAATCSVLVEVTYDSSVDLPCPTSFPVKLDNSGRAVINGYTILGVSPRSCGIQSLTMTNPQFSCSNLGDTSLSTAIDVVDVSNANKRCNINIELRDDIPPFVQCKPSLSVEAKTALKPEALEVFSADNCEITKKRVNRKRTKCEQVGGPDISVTLTVIDKGGNTNKCTTQVTVTDQTPPTAKCKKRVKIPLQKRNPETGPPQAFLTPDQIDNGSTDNCEIGERSLSRSEFSREDVGKVVNVTMTVFDKEGLSAECFTIVRITDELPPTLVCKDKFVVSFPNVDAVEKVVTSIVYTEQMMDDNSPRFQQVTAKVSPRKALCRKANSTAEVQLTVTGENGLSSTCSSTVEIVDSHPPNMRCKDRIILPLGGNTVPISQTDVDIGSFDNCKLSKWTMSHAGFTCSDIGHTDVTSTAKDTTGNTAQCTTTVTVHDIEPPTPDCKSGTVTLRLPNEPNAVVKVFSGKVTQKSTTDNCDPTPRTDRSPTQFTCGDVGDQKVLITATDEAGNTRNCSTSVVVQDTHPPRAVCRSTIVELDIGTPGGIILTPDIVDAGSTDNCALDFLSVSPLLIGCDSHNKIIPVTLTVSDIGRKNSSCVASVRPKDKTPPTVQCVPTVFAKLGAEVTPQMFINGVDSFDNCGSVDYQLDANTPFANDICQSLGPSTVTIVGTDIAGLSSSCESTAVVTTDCTKSRAIPTLSAHSVSSVSFSPMVVLDGDPNTVYTDLSLSPKLWVVFDVHKQATICNTDIVLSGGHMGTLVDFEFYYFDGTRDDAAVGAVGLDNPNTPQYKVFHRARYLVQSKSDLTISLPTYYGVAFMMVSRTSILSVAEVNNTMGELTPIAICQDEGEVTLTLSAEGNGLLDALLIEASPYRDCLADIVVNPSKFTCLQTGNQGTTLSVLAADGSDDVDTCVTQINVVDVHAPIANCLTVTRTLSLNRDGILRLDPSDIETGSGDACGADLTLDRPLFGCSDIEEEQTVTLTVSEMFGPLQTTCSAVVKVVDNVAPIARCKAAFDINIDISGTVTITPEDMDNGSEDACEMDFTITPNTFGCEDVDQIKTVFMQVHDRTQTTICTSQITIRDNVPPIASCSSTIIQVGADGFARLAAKDVDATPADADQCGVDETKVDTSTFGCDQLGLNTITLTVLDGVGLSDTCGTFVDVRDFSQPQLSCVDTLSYNVAEANTGISITLGDVLQSSTAFCGVEEFSLDHSYFDCESFTSRRATVTATGYSGVQGQCTTRIFVNDTEAPIARCKTGTVTLQLDETGQHEVDPPNSVDGGSSDDCSIAEYIINPSPILTCDNLGILSIAVTVVDGALRTDACIATVKVVDTLPPVPMCNSQLVFLNSSGMRTFSGEEFGLGTMDNCDTVLYNSTQTEFTCDSIGTHMVTLTTEDLFNNVAACNATIEIVDNIPPTLTCVKTVTLNLNSSGLVEVTPDDIINLVEDNCEIAQSFILNSQTTFNCLQQGTYAMRLISEDTSNRQSGCETQVVIQDKSRPTSTCIEDVTIQLNENGEGILVPEHLHNDTIDNCSLEGGQNNMETFITKVKCTDIGTRTAGLIVTDFSGNVDICQSTIHVVDSIPPTPFCNIQRLVLDGNGEAKVDTGAVISGTIDNCDTTFSVQMQQLYTCSDLGQNFRTVNISDDNNNIGPCQVEVVVEDKHRPTAKCRPQVVVSSDGIANITPDLIDNGSIDNCEIVSRFVTPSQLLFTSTSPTNVTLTVEDTQGNQASCTADVIHVLGPPQYVDGGSCGTTIAQPITTEQLFTNDATSTGLINLVDGNIGTRWISGSGSSSFWFEFAVDVDRTLCGATIHGIGPIGSTLTILVLSGATFDRVVDNNNAYSAIVQNLKVATAAIVLPNAHGRVLKVVVNSIDGTVYAGEITDARLSAYTCLDADGYIPTQVDSNRATSFNPLANAFDADVDTFFKTGGANRQADPTTRVWWSAPLPTLLCSTVIIVNDVAPGTTFQMYVYDGYIVDPVTGEYVFTTEPISGDINLFRLFYSASVSTVVSTFEIVVPPVYGAALMFVTNQIPISIVEILNSQAQTPLHRECQELSVTGNSDIIVASTQTQNSDLQIENAIDGDMDLTANYFDSGIPIISPVSIWLYWTYDFSLCGLELTFADPMLNNGGSRIKLSSYIGHVLTTDANFINNGVGVEAAFLDEVLPLTKNTYKFSELIRTVASKFQPLGDIAGDTAEYMAIPADVLSRGLRIEIFSRVYLAEIKIFTDQKVLD